MTVEVVFPESAKEYVRLQCNDNLKGYTECPGVRCVEKFLKDLRPRNILEVGAGLGRVSVFLFRRFGWETTNFHLLDGNSGHEQICHTHEKVGRDYYNSLQATKDFCLVNGISEERLFLLNAENDDWKQLDVKYDLCYSFRAIGFHWPVTGYLDVLHPLLEKGACLIFEIRSATWRGGKELYAEFNRKQTSGIKRRQYRIKELSTEPGRSIMVLERR